MLGIFSPSSSRFPVATYVLANCTCVGSAPLSPSLIEAAVCTMKCTPPSASTGTRSAASRPRPGALMSPFTALTRSIISGRVSRTVANRGCVATSALMRAPTSLGSVPARRFRPSRASTTTSATSVSRRSVSSVTIPTKPVPPVSRTRRPSKARRIEMEVSSSPSLAAAGVAKAGLLRALAKRSIEARLAFHTAGVQPPAVRPNGHCAASSGLSSTRLAPASKAGADSSDRS